MAHNDFRKHQQTTQELQNRGFDPTFDVPATEMLGFDSVNNVLRRIAVDANGKSKAVLYFSDGTEYKNYGGGLFSICQPYLYSIAEGDITGHSTFDKYGRVSGVNNTLVDVWYGEGGTASQYVFPASAQQMEVLSSSANDDSGNTGINTLYIEGLDANYAVISETVTMDGATPVTTSNSYLRINFCRAATVGTAGAAVGNVIVQNAANTITYAAIPIGATRTRDLIYTVPAGYTLYLTSVSVSSGKGGNSTNLNAVIFTPKVMAFGSSVWLPQGELQLINNSVVRHLEMPAKVTEKSDLKMSVKGDYASGASTCIGAVRGWLETN